MIVILLFILKFGSYTEGKMETECSVSEGTIIKCKFGENINPVQRDFTVYFYSGNGHEELLVDCAWENEQFMCIEQEGFQCKQPVSDIAVISVPSRFLNRSGTYRCVDDGSSIEDMKPCKFSDIQRAQEERQQERQDKERDHDDEDFYSAPHYMTAVIYLFAFGIVFVILIVLMRSKKYQSEITNMDERNCLLHSTNEKKHREFKSLASIDSSTSYYSQPPINYTRKSGSLSRSAKNGNSFGKKRSQTV